MPNIVDYCRNPMRMYSKVDFHSDEARRDRRRFHPEKDHIFITFIKKGFQ